MSDQIYTTSDILTDGQIIFILRHAHYNLVFHSQWSIYIYLYNALRFQFRFHIFPTYKNSNVTMKLYKYVTNLLQCWLYTTKIMLSIMFKSEILRCIFGPLAREKILGLFLKHNLQTKNRSSYFPRK